MSIFSKIGKAIKKVVKKVGKYIAPVAAIAAPFIPGVGGLLSSAASSIGGLFSAKDASTSNGFVGPPDPNNPTEGQQVTVTGSSSGGQFLKDVMPGVVGGLNYLGQQQTNVANAEQAQKQMDFQASQTGTSYQRGVDDMRKAGLNPMLAYSQGGAQSGSGAQAQMGNEIGSGANSAFSALQTLQQLEQMSAHTALLDAQARNTDAQTTTELGRPGLVGAQTVDVKQSAQQREADIQYQLLRNRLLRETFDAQASEISSASALRGHQEKAEKYGLSEKRSYSKFWDTGYGTAYPYLEKSGQLANSAASAVRKMIPFSIGR